MKINSKLIIVRIEGGHGNQMFQYSFARMIQKINGGRIILDLHTYKKDKLRKYSLDSYRLSRNVIVKSGMVVSVCIYFMRLYSYAIYVLAKNFKKDELCKINTLIKLGLYIQQKPEFENFLLPTNSKIIYTNGNWMSEKYFYLIRDQIKKEFILSRKLSQINMQLMEKIKKENSVCVHIRRGDYLNSVWADKLLVCDYYYYNKAITKIQSLTENPVFYIFSNTSDDIEWIKANYKFSAKVQYVNHNNLDFEDLAVMRTCKHFILSNSSYSWWGSYLSENIDKIVVAPKNWNNGVWNMKDIYLDKWILI